MKHCITVLKKTIILEEMIMFVKYVCSAYICFDTFLLLHIIVDDIVMLLLHFVNRCSVAKSLLSLTFKVGEYRLFDQCTAWILF